MRNLLFLSFFLLVVTILYSTYISNNGLSQADGIGALEKVDGYLAAQHHSKFDANLASLTVLNSSLDSNSSSVLFDNESRMVSFGLSSFWNDQNKTCNTNFKCTSNFSTGWKDKTSFQISSTNNTNNTWSLIYGQPIDVKPREKYQLVTHMKLNQLATQSHVALEGFNKTSNKWYQLKQCPHGTNGPLEWQEFRCAVTIPENNTKIRSVLNAGWSSQPGKEAVTSFDSQYFIKMNRPFIFDQNLKAEIVYQGLEKPTSMAFLGPNDFLVSEGLKGTIQRIVNGVKLGGPLLDLDVTSPEGLLGIAVEKNANMNRTGNNKEVSYVFIYATGAKKVSNHPIKGNGTVGDRLYRYELVDNTLANPKLLIDLPPASDHNGGPVVVGPDNHLYLVVGELKNKITLSNEKNKALNHQGKDTNKPDGRGGILRIDQNGRPIGAHGILGDKEPLNKYYAYGIRNSFGMDFDPLTGKLWDTENGPDWGDEINLVDPGFNSGWRKVQGIWTVDDRKTKGEEKKGDLASEKPGEEKKGDLASEKPDKLVDFGGKGKYSPPEFTWNKPVGPTAIKFIATDKLGKEYENDILVADTNGPRIFHFELDQNRTALHLQGPLIDKVAQSNDEFANVVFAQDFGGRITDLEIGPDGYLYIVLIDTGKIYRILPSHSN